MSAPGSSSSHASAAVIGNLLSDLRTVQGTLSGEGVSDFSVYITPHGDIRGVHSRAHHILLTPLYVGERADYGIFHMSEPPSYFGSTSGEAVPTGRRVAHGDVPMGHSIGFEQATPSDIMMRAQRLSDSLPERQRKESERSERMSREEGFFARKERERREAAEESARRQARRGIGAQFQSVVSGQSQRSRVQPTNSLAANGVNPR